MEGKKTFIFYSDWINMIREMPNEDAGVLLKHILSYVNDEDPQTDNLLVKLAFGHMKPLIKQDLEKWEAIREKRKEAGKKGGEANAKQIEANAKQVQAVNVNVNDNVNENLNKSIYTVEDSFNLFDKAGLTGRFFSTMNQIHSINEKIILEEFEKWKLLNESNNFENEKHLRNSFNAFLMKYKPQKQKTATKKTGNVFDEITENDLK